MQNRRDEVFTDAFNKPRARLHLLAFIHQRRQDRAHRVSKDDLARRVAFFKKSTDAADRAPRTNAHDKRVDLAMHLLPDLWTSGFVVRLRIRFVGKLIDVVRVGIILRDLLGNILVVLRISLRNITAREHNFCTHRAQVRDLLVAHLVRHDNRKAIAFLPRDQRKRKTRVACSRFDDATALLQLARLLGRIDHRDRDAILDRVARIHRLHLHEQLARTRVHSLEFEHRRVADHLEDVVKDRCDRGGAST